MKPIVVSLGTALVIAVLHLRYLRRGARYPLLPIALVALSGFALWATWEGLVFIPVAMLLFTLNIVSLVLMVDIGFPRYVLWQSDRAARQRAVRDE